MEMFILPYEIRTLSPVLISSDIGDPNIVRTLDYIKGSAVLGLFASSYLRKKGLAQAHEDEVFAKWFLHGQISYANAYLKTSVDGQKVQLWPTPLCLMAKKITEPVVYNIAAETVKDANRGVGTYCELIADQIKLASPRKVLNFHHYRNNRITGHSDDGGIFNYEALDKGQIFGGALYGTQQALEEFKQFFGAKVQTQIGRSRNTQYGSVEFTFSEVLKYQPQEISAINVGDKDVTLSFVSPVLLRNKNGLPEASVETLRYYLNQAGLSGFEVAKSFLKGMETEGFVSVWKMKRPAEYGLVAGSTLLLHFPDGLPEENMNAIHNIVDSGIGERRNEGYGRVRLNWLAAKVYHRIDKANPRASMPGGEPPTVVKDVFRHVLTNRLKELATVEALQEAASCKRPLTNSLLGILDLLLRHHTSEEFKNSIHGKKEWREDLNECFISGGRNLLQRISEMPDMVRWLREQPSIEKMDKAAELSLADDEQLAEELFKHYWRTVFQSLRKHNKDDQRQGGDK